MKAWLAETHGANVELVRHFLKRMFDSELSSSPGQWRKAAIGVLSALVPAALLVYPMFVHRYNCVTMQQPARECPAISDYAAQYSQLVHIDASWLIALAICVTAMATALQWESLFPSRRDVLALASFPVSPRQIFGAKFAALLAAFAGFVMALTVLPSMLFAQVIASPWQVHPSLPANIAANFGALAGACSFAFFSLMALQGIMLIVLPTRMFSRVSAVVQAAVFTLGVTAVPFAWREPSASPWWPVNWFLALWDGHPRIGLLAVALPAALAVVAYFAGYYRYTRLLLETRRDRRQDRRELRLGSRVLELFARDPREQAVLAFFWKSLLRSRTHQLVLQAVAGLAIAWIVRSVQDGGAQSVQVAAVVGPLAAATFLIAGLRFLFSLPTELKANWLFQTTEREGREAWMRATDRFVTGCVLAPVYLCAAPVAIATFGWNEALRLIPMSFVMALALFEFWFREWRKLPFTCSHLPGQRPFWLLLVVGMGMLSYLGTAAAVVYQSCRGWVAFAAVFPLACALWLKLRHRRRQAWEETSLIFDQQEDSIVESLGIRFERDSQTEPAATGVEPGTRAATPFWNSFREQEAPSPLDPFPEGDRALSAFFGMRGLWEDVRYGLRLMRKHLALSAAVTITLALGIGVNVSVLTLINGIAFRARVDEPETFAQVAFPYAGQGLGIGRVTPEEYLAYRDRTRSLQSLAAVATTYVLLGNERSAEAGALLVSCNFFDVYHLRHAKMGRLFTSGECAAPGGAPVAVLSEEGWRDRFGSDPQIIGKVIRIEDQGFTVVGVAPAHHPARINHSEVWIPYTAQPLIDPAHDMFRNHTAALVIGGRLSPGFSRRTAQAEWDVIVEQENRLHPGRKTTVEVTDGSAISMVTAGATKFYLLFALLMGAPWAVLLITCANVTTMLLARAVARRREIAVRLSLGAPRMRLLRMLLMESCLLAAIAGSAALYIAWHVPGPLFQFLTNEPPDFPLAPDWRIFAFVSGVVAITGCLAGLAPALESLKVDLTAALKGYISGGGLRVRIPVRSLLVSAQVALGLVLLVCAGLVGSMDRRLHGVSGFEAGRTLVVPVIFPSHSSRESSLAMYRDLETRITALPGVQSMTYAAAAPFLDASQRVHRPDTDSDAVVSVNAASPGYLRTLGIPIVQGRDFQDADRPSGQVAIKAIVSQSFARTFLPNRNAVGQRYQGGPNFSFDIVGVAKDVDSGAGDQLAAYVLSDWSPRGTILLIRVAGNTQLAADTVRNAVRAAYPDFLVTPRTVQKALDDRDQVGHRLSLLLLIMAAIAVVLAVAGIYGVVSFSVSQRTRELGIRVALGARAAHIVGEVLVSGMKPVMYGLFAGVWLALIVETAVRQTFSGQPLRFDTGNPVVYVCAAVVLGTAALTAMLLPAHRGAKADPLEALHYD